MAPRWRSICTTFFLEPLITVCCSLVAIGGIAVGYNFIKKSLDSSELILVALGISQDDIDMVDKARKANLGTLIGVIGVAAIALVLAWMRTYLSMNMAVRRSSIARRTSAGYLCMLIPSLTLTWLAAAYLVVVLMALAVWWATAGLVNAAGDSVGDSDLNAKWGLVKDIYGNITNLATVYNKAGSNLPLEIRGALDPAVAAISGALPEAGDKCPKYCFDLSTWSHFDETRPCFCDVSRVEDAGQPAHEAARNQLPWAVLGVALACAGLSWLAMDQAAHASRTLADRALAKRGASEFGSEAASTPRYDAEGYNGYGGADPYEPSPSAPAGHPDSGNGDPEGLGWAAVPEIPGSIPASHAAGADVNGSATTAAKSYKSSRRRLQDAGDYPGNAPDQEAPVPIVHAELAAATPYYPPGQRYTPQPLPQQQPPGVRYFPL